RNARRVGVAQVPRVATNDTDGVDAVAVPVPHHRDVTGIAEPDEVLHRTLRPVVSEVEDTACVDADTGTAAPGPIADDTRVREGGDVVRDVVPQTRQQPLQVSTGTLGAVDVLVTQDIVELDRLAGR